MRIIARSSLNGFVRNRVERRQQRLVKDYLDAWYALVSRAEWKNTAELKEQFHSASIVSSERVVFNIKGNDYRLIAGVNYQHQSIFIKWIGTHAEYDQIDAATVQHQEERYGNLSDSK